MLLFVTVEPCIMCSYAINLASIINQYSTDFIFFIFKNCILINIINKKDNV